MIKVETLISLLKKNKSDFFTGVPDSVLKELSSYLKNQRNHIIATSEGFAAGVLLIQCSMPSAILNFLVGSMYSPKENVDNVASMIFVSTVISFITIPIVVFISLNYFP